ncbi:hypothetical protein [Candidatus Entotheonella palauensis]|uniref:hypothetical protein n=1 Tax=Candidatus Entotheonella palauensis TaxID=93172 RepID=UPI000B7CB239|nr:hypothetical protein [Candidatus Entotheonella palauensis]
MTGGGPNDIGGRAGGALLIARSVSITLDGSIETNGGAGGDTGDGGRAGGGGSGGAIRLMAPVINGTSDPPASLATPGFVFLPPDKLSLRVVSVAGLPVPEATKGNFIVPDITLERATTVPVELEARNIPLGTEVRLTIIPETGSPTTVMSTPLAGTPERSTATATVPFSHGFSRIRVEASRTP